MRRRSKVRRPAAKGLNKNVLVVIISTLTRFIPFAFLENQRGGI